MIERAGRLAAKAMVALMMMASVAGLAFAQGAASFKAKQPILITSFGQSQDAKFIDLLAKRLKLDSSYDIMVSPQAVDWAKYKTLIYVIGGSGKGLGNAGVNLSDEVKRCKDLIADAKKHDCALIAMHIGGADRRKSNSAPFLDFAKDAGIMIVKEDGNQDGYFTKLSKDSGVQLRSVKTTIEIQDVLKGIFG
jgi:hypothetical protein